MITNKVGITINDRYRDEVTIEIRSSIGRFTISSAISLLN